MNAVEQGTTRVMAQGLLARLLDWFRGGGDETGRPPGDRTRNPDILQTPDEQTQLTETPTDQQDDVLDAGRARPDV